MLKITRKFSLKLGCLALLASLQLAAQKSDSQRYNEALESIPVTPPVVETPAEAVTVDEGDFQFHLIEPVRSQRPQLYVETDSGFEVIRPSFASEGPVHRLTANARIFFYERVEVREAGQTTWQHIPRYALTLRGYSGGVAAVWLPSGSQSRSPVQEELKELKWVELTSELCDFGEMALINVFEQPIAIQMDGVTASLNPGESYKSRFNLRRQQTAAVHVRIAMRFLDGNIQELFNTRVFIFENWRGILIPYFDAENNELSLFSIREKPL